jgi:glycosyltransferase involved in cell wall biosynthesis
VIYYCTDRLDESSPAARRLLGHERALLADADVVFTTSSGLLDSVSRISRRSVLLTSGVRFHEFRQPVSAASLPTALHRLGRPIVGYVGSLRNELNLPLLAQAARLAPDLTFVLVGPVVADVSALAACPNITLPGSVAHAEAIRYMRSFDVGVLPYRINAYTTNLLPVKLKEYLAAGLPIVSTGLPEVKRFVAEHGALVTFAETADAFVSALRATVASNSADDVERRVRVARHYDWSEQIASMTAVIETAFEETASGRVAVGSAV